MSQTSYAALENARSAALLATNAIARLEDPTESEQAQAGMTNRTSSSCHQISVEVVL